MKVFEEHADVFAANSKAVDACRGPLMRLDFKDPNSAPYITPIRHYTPEQRTMIQDFQGLNALLKVQRGGLGDLLTIYDEMDQSAYFSCLDLVSGFLQLTIHEADRHLTAFRDAEGKLWEYVRCGFGLKMVPSAFTNYVGGSIKASGWTISSS